jgi:hypothetical protein
VPAAAAGVALVGTHHADGPETDLLVGANSRRVRGSRVDRDAVVATILEQVAHHAADGLGAEASTVQCRVEEQVDAGVAVARLGLLPELDQAGDRAVHHDRQARRLRLIPRETLVRGVPPARHLRGRMDAAQLRLVAAGQWTQGHRRTLRRRS